MDVAVENVVGVAVVVVENVVGVEVAGIDGIAGVVEMEDVTAAGSEGGAAVDEEDDFVDVVAEVVIVAVVLVVVVVVVVVVLAVVAVAVDRRLILYLATFQVENLGLWEVNEAGPSVSQHGDSKVDDDEGSSVGFVVEDFDQKARLRPSSLTLLVG